MPIQTTKQTWLVVLLSSPPFSVCTFHSHPGLLVPVWTYTQTRCTECLVSFCSVSGMGHKAQTRVGNLCAILDQGWAWVLSATLVQSTGRPCGADQVWPASLCVTYCVAEWQVPCGIFTELTARVGNFVRSPLLPGAGLCVTFWPQCKDRTNDTAPESPWLNITHHTYWQLLLLETQFSHLATR